MNPPSLPSAPGPATHTNGDIVGFHPQAGDQCAQLQPISKIGISALLDLTSQYFVLVAQKWTWTELSRQSIHKFWTNPL